MRIVKILVIYFSVLFMGIASLSIIAFHVFQNDLSNAVLGALKPYLKADLKVERIEATLIDAFPKASIELVNVRIKETKEGATENAYDIGRVYLMFDYADLISGNIRVRHIVVRDATIRMVYDQDGQSNFEFWKIPDDTTQNTDNDVQLELDKVEVINTKYYLYNLQDDFKLSTQIKNSSFSLLSMGENTHMEILADFEIKALKDGEVYWLKGKSLKSNLGFSIMDLDKYTIQDGELEVEGMKFGINGTIDNSNPNLYTDIKIKSKYSRLEELLQLSPDLLEGSLDDYRVEGAAWFSTSIIGSWTDNSSPKFDIGFGFRDGAIEQISSGLKLTELNLDGHYSNGEKRNNSTSFIQLKSLKAKHNTGEVKGDFELQNLDNPFVDLKLKGDLDLAWASEMFHFQEIESLSGKLDADLSFAGRISDLQNIETLDNVEVEGACSLQEIRLKLKGDKYAIMDISGQLSFEKPFLMVNGLQMNRGASDLKIDGYFKNPLTFFSDKKLVLYGDLQCDSLILEEFISEADSLEEQDASEDERFNLPEYLFANVNADIGFLSYQKFEAQRIKGTARYYQKQLAVKDLDFQTFDGSLSVNGLVKANLFKGFSLDARIAADSVDVKEVFRVFDDFEQDALTQQNLEGRLSTEADISFKMQENFDIILKSLMVDAPTMLSYGELVDFMPMVKLAGFIKVGNFNHIIFDTLRSHIFIQNEIIHIPATKVNSNTFDMTLKGKHNFENFVDYEIALNMKKLFMKENKITDRSFSFYANDPSGGITLYLKVEGPVDDPKITYNTKALGGKIGEGVQRESEELKEVLQKERKETQLRRDSLRQIHKQYRKKRRRNALGSGW